MLRGRYRTFAHESFLSCTFVSVLGRSFSDRIGAMINDLIWSQILSQQYRSSSETKDLLQNNKLSFSASLLSHHVWPMPAVFETSWRLPKLFKTLLMNFNVFRHFPLQYVANEDIQQRECPLVERHLVISFLPMEPAALQDKLCLGCVRSHLIGSACPCGRTKKSFPAKPYSLFMSSETIIRARPTDPLAFIRLAILDALLLPSRCLLQFVTHAKVCIDESVPIGSFNQDEPIHVFIVNKSVPVPVQLPTVGRELVIKATLNSTFIPPFYSRPRSTSLLWIPRGQAEV